MSKRQFSSDIFCAHRNVRPRGDESQHTKRDSCATARRYIKNSKTFLPFSPFPPAHTNHPQINSLSGKNLSLKHSQPSSSSCLPVSRSPARKRPHARSYVAWAIPPCRARRPQWARPDRGLCAPQYRMMAV